MGKGFHLDSTRLVSFRITLMLEPAMSLQKGLKVQVEDKTLAWVAAEDILISPKEDLMAKHMKPEPFDRQLRNAFKVLDKECTGYVFVTELRHILTNIGEKLEPA
ncbi:hypothetical protein G4B88_027983 [Cannabis sativa]|uniref:EF-hand domain-containing protein n=1 Tax=Cannabis sativa TaxID=3483 RepID=A0A7J6I6I2_CANSA|nr:hypothetical protein G4B88_027983 [Cannabis sativa]